MSDVMLLGVLRMPIPDAPDPLTMHQFIDRARQAADRIEADVERIAALEREVEALRVDAERYRELRLGAYECVIPHGNTIDGKRTAWITKLYPGDSFDAAIDAARSKT